MRGARQMLAADRFLWRVSPAAALRQAERLSDQGKAVEAFALFARAANAGDCVWLGVASRSAISRGLGYPFKPIGGGALARASGSSRRRQIPDHAREHVRVRPRQSGPRQDRERVLSIALPERKRELQISRSASTWGSPGCGAAGSAKGQAILGDILTRGPEGLRDLSSAQAWFKRSADEGCPEGSLGYALSLARTANDDEYRAQVVHHLRQAAENGLPTAEYLLGVLAESGVGMRKDETAAASHYKRAAEMGLPAAQARYGAALMDGDVVQKDLTEAETWLRRAALAGEVEAAARVGDLNAKGGDRPPNFTEAATWYRRAAEAGHTGAARALSSLHLVGAGVPRDNVRWPLTGCDRQRGRETARRQRRDFANLLLTGAGSAEDAARVASSFRRAAEAGDPVAALNLGLWLGKGGSGTPDDKGSR